MDTSRVEEISAEVHLQWMKTKEALGVQSRKSETGEELMVPYAELSEAAKDLDRNTVRAVLTALSDLGFALIEEHAIHLIRR